MHFQYQLIVNHVKKKYVDTLDWIVPMSAQMLVELLTIKKICRPLGLDSSNVNTDVGRIVGASELLWVYMFGSFLAILLKSECDCKFKYLVK